MYLFAVFDRMKLSTKIIFLYTVDETRSWVSHSLAMQKNDTKHFLVQILQLSPHLRTASNSRRMSTSFLYVR